MTQEQFVEKIHLYTQNAKNLIEGDGGYNIQRGMAHVTSGYVEDLFALYLATKINRLDLQYLVDKVTSIRFSKNGKATKFKPDLSIINSENILTHYFDLKTNLGWNRDLASYLKTKNEFINKIKGKNAWIHFDKDNVQGIKISEKLKYKMVVVYGWNINREQMAQNIRIAKEYENVELFILNNLDENKILTIENEDFERLHTETLNLCN
ncbi:hypothetical protein GJU43_04310 [Flavobacterium sp. LC2016-23]|uniref:hypothetical protein n=1 Tax=Flavobacterium sp. LC2016-23 TaxID=2666330 RepID=UPI0012AFC850|nr:hypothetical protein [Flavobacterium sp. LC2016-23]MRX38486.1 hypothetical protein [Flavobacterium sp. LC2016-23]